MLKINLIVLALMFFVGCSSTPDRYALLDDPTHNFNTVTITWEDKEPRDFSYRTVDKNKKINGYAMYIAGEPVCTIVAPAPKNMLDKKAFEVLGEEFLHCMRGQFHKHVPLEENP